MAGELFSYISNGRVLMALCSIVIAIVFLQAILFIRQAYRQGLELGVSQKDLRVIMTNSAVFSIIPSIPILLVYVMLMPSMGRFFPWLRLSVVGSGTYEFLAANTAAETLGFSGMADPTVSPAAFITVLWVCTVCILGGPVTAVLFQKRIDKATASLQNKKSSFAPLITGAMLLGMVSYLAVPKALDVKNVLGMVTTFVSGGMVMLLGFVAKKTKIKLLDDFAFPISMIVGMLVSIVLGNAGV